MSKDILDQFRMDKFRKPDQTPKGKQQVRVTGPNKFDPNVPLKIPAAELKEIAEQEKFYQEHGYVAPERRDPAVQFEINCCKCKKLCKIYPSQLTIQFSDDDNSTTPKAEQVYICHKCEVRIK